MTILLNKKNIAYRTLKERIINISLRPGDLIDEDEITAQLKISKTPLREALQQLEGEGFVDCIPRRGYLASQLSLKDISELFEIREILECESINRICTKIDVREVEAIRERFESSKDNNDREPQDYFKAGDEIHSLIFKTLGNNRLIQIYAGIQEHVRRIRNYIFSQDRTQRSSESYKEHIEILDALAAHDPLRAENAIRNHLRNSKEFLKSII
jgi:DNA-binding GntR family transcriptional regulator